MCTASDRIHNALSVVTGSVRQNGADLGAAPAAAAAAYYVPVTRNLKGGLSVLYIAVFRFRALTGGFYGSL